MEGNNLYKNALHRAKVLRSQGVIENLFQQLERSSTNMEESEIKEHISILKQISQALAKGVEGEDVNIIDLKVVGVDHVTKQL